MTDNLSLRKYQEISQELDLIKRDLKVLGNLKNLTYISIDPFYERLGHMKKISSPFQNKGLQEKLEDCENLWLNVFEMKGDYFFGSYAAGCSICTN